MAWTTDALISVLDKTGITPEQLGLLLGRSALLVQLNAAEQNIKLAQDGRGALAQQYAADQAALQSAYDDAISDSDTQIAQLTAIRDALAEQVKHALGG